MHLKVVFYLLDLKYTTVWKLWRQKTNEGSNTASDSTINTASSYDYLKQLYEKSVMIQVGKMGPFCVNFTHVKSKPETAHWTKAPGEPFKVCASE